MFGIHNIRCSFHQKSNKRLAEKVSTQNPKRDRKTSKFFLPISRSMGLASITYSLKQSLSCVQQYTLRHSQFDYIQDYTVHIGRGLFVYMFVR